MAQPDYLSVDVDFRCPGTLHGILRDGLIERKCSHIACTQGRPVTVFHYWDPNTGELVDTKVYKDPGRKFR